MYPLRTTDCSEATKHCNTCIIYKHQQYQRMMKNFFTFRDSKQSYYAPTVTIPLKTSWLTSLKKNLISRSLFETISPSGNYCLSQ